MKRRSYLWALKDFPPKGPVEWVAMRVTKEGPDYRRRKENIHEIIWVVIMYLFIAWVACAGWC